MCCIRLAMSLNRRLLVGGASATALGLGLYATCRHTMAASEAPPAGDAAAAAAADGAALAAPPAAPQARYINDVMNDVSAYTIIYPNVPLMP